MLIYLASPIDRLKGPEHEPTCWVQEMRLAARMVMEQRGIAHFDPAGGFTVPSHPLVSTHDTLSHADVIRQSNRFILARSSAVIAIYHGEVQSAGVPLEVDHARQIGVPVAYVLDSVESLPTMQSHIEAFPRVDEALEYVMKNPRTPIPTMVVQRLDEKAQVPTKSYDADCGYDLYVLEDTFLPVGQFTDVRCGVAVDLPFGCWGFVVGRSSTIRTRGLQVQPGIVDNGYRGELLAGVWNLNNRDHTQLGRASVDRGDDLPGVIVRAGERLAQLIPLPTSSLGWQIREGELSASERGNKGFGSSGA